MRLHLLTLGSVEEWFGVGDHKKSKLVPNLINAISFLVEKQAPPFHQHLRVTDN